MDHPDLLPILRGAPRSIEEAFGRRLPMRLRVFHDWEEPTYAELIVEILFGGSDSWDAAEACLRNLHERWLKALPREATRFILFVAEPV